MRIKGLLLSLTALSKTEDYPPSISKIVNTYEQLKVAAEKEALELRKAENQKYLLAQADGQKSCRLCGNTGFFVYRREEGDFACRCECAHGRDLNKFGRYQIEKGTMWKDPSSGKEKNIYIPEMGDIFTQEELAIIRVKRMAGDNYD